MTMQSWLALGTPTEWLRRWRRSQPIDAGDSSALPSAQDPLDIDLAALESLPAIHWVTSRIDLPDAWRTQPDVRYRSTPANPATRQ